MYNVLLTVAACEPLIFPIMNDDNSPIVFQTKWIEKLANQSPIRLSLSLSLSLSLNFDYLSTNLFLSWSPTNAENVKIQSRYSSLNRQLIGKWLVR